MEILNPSELSKSIGLKTLEEAVRRSGTQAPLSIGVPKERSADERRVCITPGGVDVLVANGHRVVVEKGAGTDARFTDHAYSDAGAEIAYTAEELFAKAELIVKVAPPDVRERLMMREGQTVLSAVHLGTATEAFSRTSWARVFPASGSSSFNRKTEPFPSYA